MFVVFDMFTDEAIKEGSEKECSIFVRQYNQIDKTEHYYYTNKKDVA